MTATRYRPTHAAVTRANWCVRDVQDPDARRVAHRVDLTQTARPGGVRSALCGRPAAKWRQLAEVDPPAGLVTCPDCADTAATVRPPGPPPVAGPTLPGRVGPPPGQGRTPPAPRPRPRPSGPREDPIACTPAPGPETTTQAARVARRVAFRKSWAPVGADYVPAGPDRRPDHWPRPSFN